MAKKGTLDLGRDLKLEIDGILGLEYNGSQGKRMGLRDKKAKHGQGERYVSG